MSKLNVFQDDTTNFKNLQKSVCDATNNNDVSKLQVFCDPTQTDFTNFKQVGNKSKVGVFKEVGDENKENIELVLF